MTRCCACCRKPFAPRPQTPDQAYCASTDCQRARKRQSDSDYRINQRAAQQAWSQRNRAQQRSRDQGRNDDLAKMDVCDLPHGLYRITRHPASPRENGASWVVEITPVAMACPRKMDMSREDLIVLHSNPSLFKLKHNLMQILHFA